MTAKTKSAGKNAGKQPEKKQALPIADMKGWGIVGVMAPNLPSIGRDSRLRKPRVDNWFPSAGVRANKKFS